MSDNDEQDRLTGSYSKVIQSNLDPPEMQYDLDRGWDTIPNIVTDQSCSHCLDTGWHCWTLQDVDHNIITFEWDQACRRCAALEKTCELLPPMYRQIEYDGQKKPFEYDRLKPFPGIPVPIDRQQKLLDQIQSGELDGHSILYSGPSRTGKSVMASAILGRTVERYLNAGFEEKWRGRRLPIYRINTDQWLGEHMAWDLHQWSSEQPRPDPPMLNRNTVCKLIPNDYVSGLDPRKWLDCPDEFPPVLILEELDKVKVSEYKLKSLYTIMNMIFEAGGSVISTSNFTSKEIQERYPDWFYRRLVESSIDRLIRHRDLHKVVGRGRKKAAVEKNEAVEVPEVVNA